MGEEEADVGATLIGMGWRQGALVPGDLAQALLTQAPANIGRKPGARLVVVSHDCDLARKVDREPTVELLVTEEVAELDPEYTHAHHSRTLHMCGMAPSGPILLTADASQRFVVPKGDLLAITPEGSLDDLSLNALTHWLSNRYRRPALPDSFNTRLASDSKKHLKKAKKAVKHAVFREHVRGVYMAFEPRGEATEEQVYKLSLVAVVPLEIKSDTAIMRTINVAFGAFASAIQEVNGIEVVDSVVAADDEVTMRDLTLLQRFDFDYLSLADGDDPPAD